MIHVLLNSPHVSALQTLPELLTAQLLSPLQHGFGLVLSATKASAGLPQPGDEYDFYRSFPGFQEFCESQGDKILHW